MSGSNLNHSLVIRTDAETARLNSQNVVIATTANSEVFTFGGDQALPIGFSARLAG